MRAHALVNSSTNAIQGTTVRCFSQSCTAKTSRFSAKFEGSNLLMPPVGLEKCGLPNL